MTAHKVVSRDEWNRNREILLAKEKAFTRERDELSRMRRELPWVRVEKDYRFQTTSGEKTLAELFDGRSQLVIYHFMLGPGWKEGCKSCSFWADNFNGIDVHLANRDTTLIAASRAPLEKLLAFKKRMGWGFEWASSHDSDFNFDYHVSSMPEQKDGKIGELPGVSVFFRDEDDAVYHTYSTYGRGLDMLNSAYHYLDLTPKGRDEDALPWSMAWVRFHDRYDA